MEGLVGEVGEAVERIDPEGKVFIEGEYWSAVSTEPIEKGG
jgi:membrane-bound serine protease (ClpP class)